MFARVVSKPVLRLVRPPSRFFSTRHLDFSGGGVRKQSSYHAEPLTEVEEDVIAASTARIMSIYDDFGTADYIGEPMSIKEHSVQAAAAAAKGGESIEAQLSCLFHDIGHLLGTEANNPMGMDGCGTDDHETKGAVFLGALGFSDTVSYLAKHHVSAKRYLCAVDPNYMAKLTEASKTTLKHQGGPMSDEECREVEKVRVALTSR